MGLSASWRRLLIDALVIIPTGWCTSFCIMLGCVLGPGREELSWEVLGFVALIGTFAAAFACPGAIAYAISYRVTRGRAATAHVWAIVVLTIAMLYPGFLLSQIDAEWYGLIVWFGAAAFGSAILTYIAAVAILRRVAEPVRGFQPIMQNRP